MKKNKLFSKKQFGFITGRSTTIQLLTVLEDWTNILDDRGTVNNIYMDFLKAFDKVPHQRLLLKLRNYGITGNVWKWVEKFLVGRKQRVTVQGEFSEWSDVKSGIPQGTVLGPLLFVLFINDLPDIVSEGTEVYLFADDTKLYRRINDEEDCRILQEDLKKLLDWSDKWLLKFHPDKCKIIEIGQNKMNYNYKLGETSLKHMDFEKDIGVTVDKDLKFEIHMQEKINKANTIMGIIRRSFTYLDCNMFNKLYKALVRPHLEYANPVWSPSLQKNKIAIENVQKRATRCIGEIKHLDYKERLKRLKLPTLVYRRLRGDIIETYKITSGKYDSEISNLFQMYNTQQHRTGMRGHSKKIFKKRPRLNIKKNFFTHRIIDTWNSLPENVVSAPSLKAFERRLDKHWSGQDIVFDFLATLRIKVDRKREVIEEQEDLDIED